MPMHSSTHLELRLHAFYLLNLCKGIWEIGRYDRLVIVRHEGQVIEQKNPKIVHHKQIRHVRS